MVSREALHILLTELHENSPDIFISRLLYSESSKKDKYGEPMDFGITFPSYMGYAMLS